MVWNLFQVGNGRSFSLLKSLDQNYILNGSSKGVACESLGI